MERGSMLVKDLARVLNGVPGNFQVWVTGVNIRYGLKLVELEMIPKAQPPPIEEKDKRFFPNITGMHPSDDFSEFGNNTTPQIDLSNPPKQSSRFSPNEAGWTKENEYYYQKWKNGGNNLTYVEELEEIDKLEQNDDYGSNTIPNE